uniref:Uncharacterized protein n=1 Tax=Arundo donax TaxID=35708 RepID=A0A0A9FH36_ARUDO
MLNMIVQINSKCLGSRLHMLYISIGTEGSTA